MSQVSTDFSKKRVFHIQWKFQFIFLRIFCVLDSKDRKNCLFHIIYDICLQNIQKNIIRWCYNLSSMGFLLLVQHNFTMTNRTMHYFALHSCFGTSGMHFIVFNLLTVAICCWFWRCLVIIFFENLFLYSLVSQAHTWRKRYKFSQKMYPKAKIQPFYNIYLSMRQWNIALLEFFIVLLSLSSLFSELAWFCGMQCIIVTLFHQNISYLLSILGTHTHTHIQ